MGMDLDGVKKMKMRVGTRLKSQTMIPHAKFVLPNCAPKTKGIINILRSTGYDVLECILELNDNSLSKKATLIQNLFAKGANNTIRQIFVIDNGTGMTIEELVNAWIIGIEKVRDDDDDGEFHIGMKSATWNLGNKILILSKRAGGQIVGIYADIAKMESRNSFEPEDYSECVTREWANTYNVPEHLFQSFQDQSSGTYIQIDGLLDTVREHYADTLHKLKKDIPQCYKFMEHCTIAFGDMKSPTPLEKGHDLFHTTHPNALEHPPHKTKLCVYKGNRGESDRFVEWNTQRRMMLSSPTAIKTYTLGTESSPTYYEWNRHENGKLQQIPVDQPTETPIGYLDITVIQTTKEQHEIDKETTGSTDFKGFYFTRNVREVGSGKRLGTKFGDRAGTGVGDRQRTHVRFTRSVGKHVGVKFNKQMEDKKLPNLTLNDVLLTIHKVATDPWTKIAQKEANDRKEKEQLRLEAQSTTTDASRAVHLLEHYMVPSEDVDNAFLQTVMEHDRVPRIEVVPEIVVAATEPVAATKMVVVPMETVNVPMEPVNVPVEPVNVPVETVNVPMEPVNVPMEPVNVPVETIGAPTETMDAPTETMDAPTETMDAPVVTPMETLVSNVETLVSNVETVVAPVEMVDVPKETVVAPVEMVDVPKETVDVPKETVDVPKETVDVPKETVDVPKETVDFPKETVDAAVGTEPVPVETKNRIVFVENCFRIQSNSYSFQIPVCDPNMPLCDWLHTLSHATMEQLSHIL